MYSSPKKPIRTDSKQRLENICQLTDILCLKGVVKCALKMVFHGPFTNFNKSRAQNINKRGKITPIHVILIIRPEMILYTLFENQTKMSHLNFTIFAFSTNFCLIEMSGNTFEW